MCIVVNVNIRSFFVYAFFYRGKQSSYIAHTHTNVTFFRRFVPEYPGYLILFLEIDLGIE